MCFCLEKMPVDQNREQGVRTERRKGRNEVKEGKGEGKKDNDGVERREEGKKERRKKEGRLHLHRSRKEGRKN